MKSPCRNFSIIAAVLLFLTIFEHHVSEALKQDFLESGEAAGYQAGYRTVLRGRLSDDDIARQLAANELKTSAGTGSEGFYASFPNIPHLRRLEATGEDDDATPSNLLHIKPQDLSLDCQDGCTAEFALITSTQCNSADAKDSALEFKLEKEITFDPTHMKKDEDAPDYGWATKPFRELASKSTDNTTASTTPPISMAEFVTTVAMAVELIDAMTPNKDYNLAVYLYNNETEPLACTTLELVTEDEELQEYYALFGGGEEGSVVGEGGEKPVGVVGNDSSSLAGGMLAYAVAGVSVVLSAILFA